MKNYYGQRDSFNEWYSACREQSKNYGLSPKVYGQRKKKNRGK